MGRYDDEFEGYDDSESPAVLAARVLSGGTVEEVAVKLANNPALLAEVASAMAMPPFALQMQLERLLDGKPSEVIEDAKRSAEMAMTTIESIREERFAGQSVNLRRSLAVSRLEQCYSSIYAMGMQAKDWRAIKAAANVAVDIARVDGSLREKETVESELDRAAKVIEQRRAKALTDARPHDSRIIEAAIVSKPEGVQDGRGSAVPGLEGAAVVGGWGDD